MSTLNFLTEEQAEVIRKDWKLINPSLAEYYFQRNYENFKEQSDSNPKTLHLVYHSKDFDGIFSAILVSINSMLYENYDVINLIPYNYQKKFHIINYPEDFIEENNDIIFIDVTPPLSWFDKIKDLEFSEYKNKISIFDHHYSTDLKIMKWLNKNKNDFQMNIGEIHCMNEHDVYNIIDHYQIEINNIEINLFSPIQYQFDNPDKLSAALIYYHTKMDNFLNNLNCFDVVNLISSWDTFNFYDYNVKNWKPVQFQFGLSEKYKIGDYEYKDKYGFVYDYFNGNLISKIMNELLDNLSIDINKYIEIGDEVISQKQKDVLDVEGKIVIIKNKSLFMITGGPTDFFATEYIKNFYPDLDGIIYSKSESSSNYSVSIRGINNDFDCAKFCEQFGGGGHFGVGGFSIDKDKFNSIINEP